LPESRFFAAKDSFVFADTVDSWRWINPAKWLVWPFAHLFDWLAGLFRRKEAAAESATESAEEIVEEITIEPEADAPEARWPEERRAVVNGLWGEDTITPGVSEYIMETVQLLGLTEANSLLYLGAGMGGPARKLNSDTGVWVTGLEADPELAEIGAEKSRMSGLTKKAPVNLLDPENPKIKANSLNAAVGLECFFMLANKEGLFEAIAAGLRAYGTLMFTDFVVTQEGKPADEVLRWMALESGKPNLWTPEQVAGFLGGHNMEVQIAEDITDYYRMLVIRGWANYIAAQTKATLTANAAAIIKECEYWLYKIAALDTGTVRLYRFRAEKLG